MPFDDEPRQVTILDYQPQWPAEFERIAALLREALVEALIAIDHVGSTSVPGLPAKDCIDLQVRIAAVDERSIAARMTAAGFRCRPEPWNRSETSGGTVCRKLVFAPPVGARACNVHLRGDGAPNARYALLFRDYLRADDLARDAWGAFKTRLAASVPDLADYGQIKAPATEVLMRAAEQWADRAGWSPAAAPGVPGGS